jgi:hypothetical protein
VNALFKHILEEEVRAPAKSREILNDITCRRVEVALILLHQRANVFVPTHDLHLANAFYQIERPREAVLPKSCGEGFAKKVVLETATGYEEKNHQYSPDFLGKLVELTVCSD